MDYTSGCRELTNVIQRSVTKKSEGTYSDLYNVGVNHEPEPPTPSTEGSRALVRDCVGVT